jgi:pilus assembly protein CpaB
MKMTIVLLVVLGLVAAVCAMVLVEFIPNLINKTDTREISVLKATRSIAANTDLTEDDLELSTIDLSEEAGYYASESAYLTDMINAVGKTVSSDIVAGQPVTKDKIITDPDRATILKALKDGMRAYAVRLSGDQIIGGLLEPGSFVDVLVAFTTRGGSGNTKGEAVSRTFLEKIKVIAIKGELAARSDQNLKGNTSGGVTRSSESGWTVTLLVDTVQAEALQLATEQGRISLTLRNPTDNIKVNSRGTVLDTSKVGDSSMFFDPPSQKDQAPDNDTGNSTDEIQVIVGNKISYETVPASQLQTDQKKQ